MTLQLERHDTTHKVKNSEYDKIETGIFQTFNPFNPLWILIVFKALSGLFLLIKFSAAQL